MITMNVDADTYLHWLSEIANLWFEKGQEPSIVRRRNSGVWKVTRSEATSYQHTGEPTAPPAPSVFHPTHQRQSLRRPIPLKFSPYQLSRAMFVRCLYATDSARALSRKVAASTNDVAQQAVAMKVIAFGESERGSTSRMWSQRKRRYSGRRIDC